jgi:PEP-CTERM motif-containing protein
MKILLAWLTIAVAATPLTTRASSITYSFSSGGLGASADFVRSGSNLIVTLTNTGTADALVPTDILTAVFFDVAGNPALTRSSAMVPVTSEVYEIGNGSLHTPGDRVVGGEWAFRISNGISSTGLGIFGTGDLFPGPNLQGPAGPDGVQFGIIPLLDNLTTGNGGISGSWMIRNAAVFTLGGFTAEPNTAISNVVFQYGTALDEPQYSGQVPEPSSLVLAALGCVGMAILGRRRRR